MVNYCVDFMGKDSVTHYRIKKIKYNETRDYFNLKLQSHFDNFPEINVQVNYYCAPGTKLGYIMADTDDPNCVLNRSARQHVEDMSEIVTNSIRKVLRGDKYAKNNV